MGTLGLSWSDLVSSLLMLATLIGLLHLILGNKHRRKSIAASSSSNNLKTKMGNDERTFIMIKPDGVQRGLMGDIIKRFVQTSEDHLKKHYADLSSKPFFAGLVKYMASGP